MKTNYFLMLLLSVVISTSFLNAQTILFSDDFETGYINGASLNGVNNWQVFSGATVNSVNSGGNGANGSDWYGEIANGAFTQVQRVYELVAGEDYQFSIKYKRTNTTNGALKIQVFDISSGNTLITESANGTSGVWADLSVSFTAGASVNHGFRITQVFGTAFFPFDDVQIVCTSCSPPSGPTLPNDVTFNKADGYLDGGVDLGDATQNSGSPAWATQNTTAYTTFGTAGYASVAQNFQRALLKAPIMASAFQTISIKIDFRILGTFDPAVANAPLMRFVLDTSNDVATVPDYTNDANHVMLTTKSGNLATDFGWPNVKLPVGVTDLTTNVIDWSLVMDFNLGSDAASSTIDAQLLNNTEGTQSPVETVSNSFKANLYNAITAGAGAYFIIHTQNYKAAAAQPGFTQTRFDQITFSATSQTLSVSRRNAFEFKLYPNPVNNVLNINSKEPLASVTAFDMLGRTVLKVNNVSDSINVSSLNKGVYILQLEAKNGSISTKRIIKQ